MVEELHERCVNETTDEYSSTIHANQRHRQGLSSIGNINGASVLVHQAVPLLQNPTPAENVVFAAILVSFGVAWCVGFSAQENIRRHLPADVREARIYGGAVDRYAFAPTTPRDLQTRYLLAHGLFILPCFGGVALCLMISNGRALCVCLGFLALCGFQFGRSWRRFSGARSSRRSARKQPGS